MTVVEPALPESGRYERASHEPSRSTLFCGQAKGVMNTPIGSRISAHRVCRQSRLYVGVSGRDREVRVTNIPTDRTSRGVCTLGRPRSQDIGCGCLDIEYLKAHRYLNQSPITPWSVGVEELAAYTRRARSVDTWYTVICHAAAMYALTVLRDAGRDTDLQLPECTRVCDCGYVRRNSSDDQIISSPCSGHLGVPFRSGGPSFVGMLIDKGRMIGRSGRMSSRYGCRSPRFANEHAAHASWQRNLANERRESRVVVSTFCHHNPISSWRITLTSFSSLHWRVESIEQSQGLVPRSQQVGSQRRGPGIRSNAEALG
nr:hypothetical protein CFP56_00657 [Quercus suber]